MVATTLDMRPKPEKGTCSHSTENGSSSSARRKCMMVAQRTVAKSPRSGMCGDRISTASFTLSCSDKFGFMLGADPVFSNLDQ